MRYNKQLRKAVRGATVLITLMHAHPTWRRSGQSRAIKWSRKLSQRGTWLLPRDIMIDHTIQHLNLNKPPPLLHPLHLWSLFFNNDKHNKEMENIKQEGKHGEMSNQMRSSNSLPSSPFLGCLKKKGNEQQFHKFLDVLKRLHINISFVDALEQIPS
ncbi:uncharacterized protein E6C27_scaffold157G00550 [Cucumis melo var. makuwa]|uniref:Uncharacterized protein n=1 Tax=Cucumis melo var. makuwa TaxID=1194695 RepID=A0A5A7TRU2_CUCMM|nr:uncharacterized protein E6C27_scaffold157G00550 [Cucumis melo var. makuwa]